MKFYFTHHRSTSFFILPMMIGFLSLTGCLSPKQLTYFQPGTGQLDTLAIAARYVPRIQSGDVLSLQVSSLNPEASSFFNPYATLALATGQGSTAMSYSPSTTTPLPPMNGYLVDNTGAIDLPVLGRVNVAGQTLIQIKDNLRDLLKPYLKEPTVNVRNLNFRISVMGEVVRPSLFTIPNEQITLLEALSLSGDVTVFGRRDNVLVVRQENGKQTFSYVDLTKRDLFQSPYYYLRPGDVVYVAPSKARTAVADRTYQVMPFVMSGLSVIAIVVSRL